MKHKRSIITLLMVTCVFCVAYAVDNRMKQTEMIYDGDTSDMALYWGAEGENDHSEGEEDGFYHLAEGEDGIGIAIDNTEVVTIEADGIHGVVAATDLTADSITMNEGEGYIALEDGTAADPSIYVNIEGERSGFYAEGEGIGVSVEETSTGSFEDDGWNGDVIGDVTGDVTGDLTGSVSLDDGSAAAPSLNLSSDTDTGLFYKGAGELGVAIGGAEEGYFDSTGWVGTVVGNVTGNLSGNVTGNVTGDLTGSIVLDAGLEATPSLSLTGDANTGMWSSGADTIDFSTNATKRLTLDTTALTSTLPYYAPDGAVGTPSFTFTSDTDTGIYNFGADVLQIVAGGSAAASFESGKISTANFQTSYSGAGGGFVNVGLNGLYVTGVTNVGLQIAGASVLDYGVYTVDRTRSAGTFTITDTNYYEGVDHNSLIVQAARGTSASPDYLNDNDVIYEIQGEARDGVGTWGQGASIRFLATDDHASGDTPAEISFYSTKDGSDTEGYVGAFNFGIFQPGVLNVNFPYLDARTFWAKSFGSDAGFGYYEDIMAGFGVTIPDGVSVFDSTTLQPIRITLGMDNYLYWGGSGTNVGETDTWRIGDNASDAITLDQYDSGYVTRYTIAETAFTQTYSGAACSINQVNYYEGATHASYNVQAARGTSASPDYLDDDDVIFDLNVDARDGAGTWGDSANIKIVATDDHASGDTPAEIQMWVTADGADTGTQTVTIDENGIYYDKTIYNTIQSCIMLVNTGGTLPGITNLLDKDGDDTGIDIREFDIGEEGSLALAVPKWYKNGSDITPVIRWGSNDAPSGTDYVKWELTYCIASNTDTIPDSTTISVETAYDTQYEQTYSAWSAISGTGIESDDMIYFNIERVVALGDAFAGEAWAPGICWIFEKDRAGGAS